MLVSPIPPDLASVPAGSVTRFAPSPTGFLHLGHVANAVWTWGAAQATGARVLLRIEDHDRTRCRPEYESAILQDLEWLGLEPDDSTRPPPRQSERDQRYRAAADRAAGTTRVYFCGCSRRQIALALGGDAPPEGEELRYPGTCRELGLAPSPGRGIRIVLPDAAVEFHDLRVGPVTQRPARQCGDLLARDPNGNWTYQFAVTVDDLEDGVTLVVRGEDLLGSTGRQILLSRWLGRATPPRFLHHPLILGDRGVKLSKRDGAESLAAKRAEGWARERILSEAAYLTGLSTVRRPIGPAELGSLFRR